MTIEFSGEVWFWKGPALFYFVTVPEKESRELQQILTAVTYGWGMIPVNVRVGEMEWYTALWPKDGRWILPLKDAVRRAEKIDEGDVLTAKLEVTKGRNSR
ncbi:MAG TPA: DUF1905 domain-containing protein [Fimbriimonadaceae bacterium]|nr:DUF1905 domain-containing protein [Fimbriimonadaceae bacterium]